MLQAVGRANTSHGITRISKASPFAKSLSPELHPEELRDALTDLYGLLEDYAPTWYSQEHRKKAEKALRFR
jgi:hypothetical protein